MTDKRRDRCSVCLAEFLVKADGTIRYHGPHPRPCPGSGKSPAIMHDPMAEDGWARALLNYRRQDRIVRERGSRP